jgi:hypothetical protein
MVIDNRYTKVCKVGTLRVIFTNTSNKPKLSRGKGLEKELKKPLHHLKLKLKRPNNVFGDKPNLNMEIKPHMLNNKHHIKEMP